MKSLKFLAKIIIFLVIVIFAFNAYDYYRNKQAYDVKEEIIKTLNTGFNEQKSIELENIGGMKWEQICFISYELNGIDVSNGLDIPVRYLKIPESAFSQIANESYNEFKGNEYGIAFWSLEHKMFVAILLKDAAKIPSYECHDAQNLVLLSQIKLEGRILTFNKKTIEK